MSDTTDDEALANTIDIAALAELPATPTLRQLRQILAQLPAPVDDLCGYDHPVSEALGQTRKVPHERWSWLVFALGDSSSGPRQPYRS